MIFLRRSKFLPRLLLVFLFTSLVACDSESSSNSIDNSQEEATVSTQNISVDEDGNQIVTTTNETVISVDPEGNTTILEDPSGNATITDNPNGGSTVDTGDGRSTLITPNGGVIQAGGEINVVESEAE